MTLKEIRKSKHLTLKQVANAIGIHYSALSKIERGDYSLKDNVKKKLLDYYNISEYDNVKTSKEIIASLEWERDFWKTKTFELKEKIRQIKKVLK